MKRLRLCIFLSTAFSLFFFQPASEAQLSAYGMIAYSTYGFGTQNYGYSFNNDTASLGGGAFYNFPIHSRLTAGIDGRVLYGPATLGGVTVDAALRIGFVPSKVRFRPYFEIGGGMVSALTSPGPEPQRFTNGGVEFTVGLDTRITDSIDWRTLEYGATVGPTGSGIDAGVLYVDSGIVYHFRPAAPGGKSKH